MAGLNRPRHQNVQGPCRSFASRMAHVSVAWRVVGGVFHSSKAPHQSTRIDSFGTEAAAAERSDGLLLHSKQASQRTLISERGHQQDRCSAFEASWPPRRSNFLRPRGTVRAKGRGRSMHRGAVSRTCGLGGWDVLGWSRTLSSAHRATAGRYWGQVRHTIYVYVSQRERGLPTIVDISSLIFTPFFFPSFLYPIPSLLFCIFFPLSRSIDRKTPCCCPLRCMLALGPPS